MARVFTGSSSLYLTAASVPVSDEPLTMSIWVYPTDLTSDWSGYFTLTNSGRSQYYQIRTLSYFDYRPMFQAAGTSTSGYSLHGSLMSLSTWQHLCGVTPSSSERVIYFNGSAASPNYSSIGTSTPTITDVGAGAFASSRTRYARAWLAEAAIWNVALSSTEVLSLSKGASPFRVRPESLVAYWPILGRQSPEPTMVGGIDLTVVGSPARADQPTIYRPHRTLQARKIPLGGTFKADATILASVLDSFNVDAAIQRTILGSFTVDSRISPVFNLTIDAVIQGLVTGSITVDALIATAAAYQPRQGVAMLNNGVFMV